MYGLLRYIPKNHLSYLVGKLAALPLFPPLSTALIKWYVKRYGVDVSDIARPLNSYRSLAEFFVRDLAPGARSVGSGIVSPVDGTLRSHGPINAGRIPQVKDTDYSVDDLLGGGDLSRGFDDGYYFNLYLSPRDYHQVHSPVSGRITGAGYIPGKLWPVNDWAFGKVPALFCVNERLITYIESEFGRMAVVMVGAVNVGKITVVYDSLVTNSASELFRLRSSSAHVRTYAQPSAINRGDKLGIFHLGSSVILLLENGVIVPRSASSTTCVPRPVRLGETLINPRRDSEERLDKRE